MNVKLAYLGKSGLRNGGTSQVLGLAPNLAREAVSFDAPLLKPLRFREAISALHDVVISDLRFKPRDKSAYEEWKKREHQREKDLFKEAHKEAKEEILSKRQDVPKDLEKEYNRCLRTYWRARQKYANYLLKHDMELWRKLMPCDPVVTVAEDVLFFECFSADESSYGCLTVNREDGFGRASDERQGTTNVDYSWDLFNHFQALRSYRETRFKIDPEGFEVATEGHVDYREEKIDLPPGWLRGFMELQGAMGLPMRKISISREALYSVLVWLKRHKAKKSPRSIRFELLPGKPPRLVLEPWEQIIDSLGTVYDGPETAPIKTWGRQRLLVLARLLPLIEGVDVYLLGTGLPSFWVARMGEMRLTLGLSGWTTNDWTRGSAVDLLKPPLETKKELRDKVSEYLQRNRKVKLDEVTYHCTSVTDRTAAALNDLAHSGQVIHDLHEGLYRWRQIMPRAVGEAEMGPPHPEMAASKQILSQGRIELGQEQEVTRGMTLWTGKVESTPCEILMNTDGLIKRGKCLCGYYRKYSLRNGPCRHMLALRGMTWDKDQTEQRFEDTKSWFESFAKWAGR